MFYSYVTHVAVTLSFSCCCWKFSCMVHRMPAQCVHIHICMYIHIQSQNYQSLAIYIVQWVTALTFYRVTLCICTVFVVARCRLSVTLMDCIQTAEDIVGLFSWPGSPMILFLLTPSADTQFPEELLQWGRKIHTGHRVGKFAGFDGNRRLSRKPYEIGPWLLWNINRKS